jgi:hypothetical protein
MKRSVSILALLASVHCDKHEAVPAIPAATIAPQPAAPTAPPPPAEAEPASEHEPPASPKPAARAQALAAIAGWRNLIRHRVAVGAQSDEACDARTTAQGPKREALQSQLGEHWLHRKTRYADHAPYLGWDVDGCLAMCLACTSPGDDQPVPHECKMALVALDDLTVEVNAMK